MRYSLGVRFRDLDGKVYRLEDPILHVFYNLERASSTVHEGIWNLLISRIGSLQLLGQSRCRIPESSLPVYPESKSKDNPRMNKDARQIMKIFLLFICAARNAR